MRPIEPGKFPTKAQLKREFPRETQVKVFGRTGIVTGYGREAASPGIVLIRFDGVTTPQQIRWTQISKVVLT